jgi:hypothetical protein
MTAMSPVFSRNPDEWETLQHKHLVIVGLGSVGSALSVMAARAGVGRFTLIDPEPLDEANVGRHCCGLPAAGTPKVNAVAELIRQINPQANVIQHQDDFRMLVRKGFDARAGHDSLLIGATDSFQCQSLINVVSLESGVPALYAGCWNAATVGEILYVIPGRTACYECFARFRQTHGGNDKVDTRKYTDPDFDETRQPPDAGLWANILIFCGFAFHIALSLLEASSLAPVLLEDRATIFFVNVAEPNSPLPFWRVTKGTFDRGCGVCSGAA